jgi:hypothetical protein
MMLFSYYSHLADLRTDILLEELACLSEGGKKQPNVFIIIIKPQRTSQ